MLASPIYPITSFGRQEDSQYKPAKDLDAFNSLLPPPIEFIEGSSSGALAVPEGKYEPINVTPKATRSDRDNVKASPSTPVKNTTDASAQPIKSMYNGPIEIEWPPGWKVGPGMHNTGNSCFLNSAMQCLLHTTPLINITLHHSTSANPCRVKGFCMSCCMKTILNKCCNSKRIIAPLGPHGKLQDIAKHMRTGRQEDTHEFLRFAIDGFQKSCLSGLPQKFDPKLAETTWVHQVFGGHLRSRVTCKSCGHNSDTFDSILDLSLDIYGVHGLREALRKFVAVDHLKGADKYKCEQCKRPVIAEKQFTVHNAPTVLTVHLKRFSPLGRKIGHHVNYEERLSLQPFMSDGQFGPTYNLYGVISHAGGGPNSGHYYAHVKAPDGRWYEMNDESVSPVRGATSMKNAYMLFYLRDKGEALKAAITGSLKSSPIITKPAGIAAGMKKRKVQQDDEDGGEDTGVKTSKPFIGPQLPAHLAMSNKADSKRQKTSLDPQAELIKKKIEAASKKTNDALLSIQQYADEDEESEKEENADPLEKVGKGKEKDPEPLLTTLSVLSSPARLPPSSPPSSSQPMTSLATPSPATVDPGSFYANGKSSSGKKRKHEEADENSGSLKGYPHKPHSSYISPNSPSSRHRHKPKTFAFRNGANPYRLAGSNDLRSERTNSQIFNRKKQRPLM